MARRAGEAVRRRRRPARVRALDAGRGGDAVSLSLAGKPAGRVTDVLGPVVRARLDAPMSLGEVGYVAEERLFGEVVAIDGSLVTLQVYESTVGVTSGAPVFACGFPLSVQLGPGLIGGIFDGLQRPLATLARADGDFLRRGRHPAALDAARLWRFEPCVRAGDVLDAGALIGTVRESDAFEHRVIVPPASGGRVVDVAGAGSYTIEDPIVTIATASGGRERICLAHRWPVRVPRPYGERLPLTEPLITGQRVLDTFFPAPLGGTVGMPGGFGTGKTVMQQQLCKWAQADVIIFVGCGERGNEMAEVL